MILHPDRYNVTTTLIKNGVVIHDSEGQEGTLPWGQAASAQLVQFLQRPGDRTTASGSVYGSGYHAVAKEDGTYIEIADRTAAPFHAPPLNSTFWSICIPGKAAQTRAQWLDVASRQYIKAVARYIVDRWTQDGKVWSLTFRSSRDLIADQALFSKKPSGYTSHGQVSLAWGKTNHTDPGVAFPWDVLAEDITALLHKPDPLPEPEDDVKYVIYQVASPPAVFGGLSYGPDYPALQVEWLKDDERINVLRGVGAIDYPGGKFATPPFKYATLIGALPPAYSAADFAQVAG